MPIKIINEEAVVPEFEVEEDIDERGPAEEEIDDFPDIG